ncbi:MarR family transcriptional regulator, partial [Paenibacillus sp. 28ISP30-2]|nr:MarR family transcriptional regulator [Paenibacillus sp. 28ISP30-2]
MEVRTCPLRTVSYFLPPTVKALDFSPVLQGILDEFNADLVQNLSDEEEDLLIALLQKISIDPGE